MPVLSHADGILVSRFPWVHQESIQVNRGMTSIVRISE
jgi:hypothetical protein